MSSSVISDALTRMRCGKRKGPEVILLWRTSLTTAVEDPEFVSTNAAELAGLLIEAVRTYADTTCLRAVLNVARLAASRSDALVKALAGAVVKQASVLGPGKPVTLSRHEMFGLITLARVAVQKLDPASAKKAVVKLVEVQGILADTLSSTPVKWNVVSRQLKKELKSQEPVIQDVIELAKVPPPSATAGSPHVLARALLDYAGLHPAVQASTHQEVLGIWCDKVVNGRERVTPEIAACYARLLKALTADDFNSKVVPAVTRSLRRTSEVAMTALSALLAAAPDLDISSQAVELAGILVQQMRTKESVRPLAVAALQQVAQHTGDAQALGQLVALVKGLLDGSAEGKIKVVAERVVLTQALTGLSSSTCAKGTTAPLADQVVTFAVTAAKDEANDEARGALLGCASAWLVYAAPGSSCISQVVAVLGPAMRDTKEALRRQALKTAAQMAKSCPHLKADLSALVEPAAKVVGDALAKPALRLDGVLALAAAVQLATAGSPADDVLDKEKVWAGALKPDSSLLGLAGAGKLGAADAVYLVELSEALLSQHPARVAAVTGAEDLVCSLLAGLSLHYSKDLRAAARAALSRLAAEPRLLKALGAALSACASAPASVAGFTVAPDASGEDAVLQAGTLAARLADAITALVPAAKDKPLDVPEFCALLLAAHHPAITKVLPRRAAANVWKTIQNRLPAQSKALPGMALGLTQMLFGPQGVGSQSPAEVSAAQSALGACMAMAPASMMPPVQEALGQLLDRTAHDALTHDELDIWATPRGMLASERVPEGVYVGQVVESKNVRKARGRFKSGVNAFGGADDDDDDEPAPVKKPVAAPTRTAAANGAGARAGSGPVKKDAAARQAEWRQAKLAEEEQVRSRVDAIRARIELGTTTMCAVVAGNTRAAGLRLEPLQQLVMPLLSSQIAGNAAFNAVRGLGSCMAAPLHLQALSTAAALRLVVLAQEGDRGVRPSDVPAASQVTDVVHAMRKVTGDRKQLSGPAYRFLFPVLQAVLSSPVHTPLHDEALALVSLHCGPGLEVPRSASLALLHHLLGVMPAYRDRVTGLLKQLAAGCKEEEEVVAAFKGVIHGASHVRAAALSSLQELPCLAEPGLLAGQSEVVCMLLLACHDPTPENAQVAQALWAQAGCTTPPDFVEHLVGHVTQCPSEVQQAAGAALSNAVKAHPGSVGNVLSVIIGSYQSDDDVLPRRGCATALKALAADLGDAEVTLALDFLIGNGLADPNDKVREEMVSAGTSIVDAHGAAHAPKMLPLFESHLDQRNKDGNQSGEEAAHDLVREGVVVFMGTLARHLPANDPKRASVVDILVSVLSTPSEAVQRAVSNCMAPLMAPLSVNKEAIDNLVARLLATLTKGKTYGERRGAAFGIAGLVKGLGYMSMTNCGIMDALKTAVEDKKDPGAREGALMAFECLSDKLGKLFEPYIIKILPLLLNCFGDPIPEVRAATEDAARMIMGQLTGSGVKLVLPSLLKGLEDKVWRTKQGSVQLLGSMAHCAPKQLGSCLPTIVPRLSEVLSDPHPKVQAAANESLKEVGSVIRNPEVSSLVPHLLKAIADPNTATRPALDVLLETVFVNTIDAASLALIVPVIHRGLRDRTGDTKKRAARIAGNMASLVNDPKDMVPYVPLLRPELQKALVDPLPDVRAMSARAMGSLMQGMGTEQFGDLVPWLMTTLRSDASSVERSGAAQGLAEVLAVLGPNHLEALLPELLAGCSDRSSPFAREGHLVLLHYLPVTLEKAFHSYLGRVLPAVLDGLADESEGVRDAALAAGRILVDHYANSALPLLLPAVEEGIFQESWRIRQSSVKLLGKLLFKVAGTSGNIVLDGGSDDEGAAEEGYNEAIIQALGLEKRNEVLSRLYICRSDPQYPVRTEALHVWKSVVSNTPKTLGQLLPSLMSLIIECLADEVEDRQIMAGRCLGELVRKMSERVLHRIIPILVQGVHAPAVSTRQGVCLGMREVLENIGRQQMAENLTELLPAVQAALCDEDAGVREAAGGAFSIMFKGGASSAVDSVVPSMLEGLGTAKYSESVEGLRVILGVRPQMVNSVLPKLMKQPLQIHSLKAVKELAEVAAPVIQHHLKSLIPTLLTLANKGPGEKEDAAAEAVAAIARAVPDESVFLLLQELRKSLDESSRRHAAAVAIAGYATARKTSAEPLMEQLPTLLDALISLFADEDASLVLSCWQAVEALTALIPKEEAGSYVRCVKEAVATAKETERRKRTGKALVVAGLCLPKALSPLLPIYLQGVLQGASTDIREQAAEGLGELVSVSSEESVKPYVVQITGPLIRIMGDRFPAPIKAAILVTLGVLIKKASLGLKPFVPQLQTTFLKCLADPADGVRAQAALNLGDLARMSPRVEQLANDLCSSARVAEVQIRDSYLIALAGLLASSGDRLSEAVLTTLTESLLDMGKLSGDDEQFRYALAGCLGALSQHVGEEQLRTILNWGPIAPTASPGVDRQLHACVLATVVKAAGARLKDAGLVQPVMDAVNRFSRDSQVLFKVAAGRAVARLAVAQQSVLADACNVLGCLMGPDQSSEVQRQSLLAVRRMAAALAAAGQTSALEKHFGQILPPMCAIASTTSGPLKNTCEISLARVLQLEDGTSELASRYLASGPGGTVRTTLTDPFMRRVSKLTEDTELFVQEEF